MISWLFEIDTLRLSTKDVTWSATEYSGLIIADSFSGITMRWNIAGNGLIAPNEMTFDVSNPGGTYSIGDFEGEFCTVRLIEDDSNTRTWKFKIERAISYYGKITCYCVDFLQEHLVGDYPNTKAPKEIWPSSDAEDSDDYCVPVILGTAYIPVRSVNTDTERYYILGEDITPLEYTVDEVMSPHAWPNSHTWTPPTYDMDTSVDSGYQLLQPKIDERVTPPATGLWPSGDSFYDMLCKYSRADTALITNPADWAEYVLKDFGVAGTDIDSTTFAAAGTAYGELFSGGGWWKKEPRERALSNLLAQTDSFLKCTDKVELHQFSATPVETITDVLLLSFSPSKVTKAKNDSGRVHWPESATKPSDILTGTTVVPTHGGIGATENTPSSEVLECKFLAGDSVSAQKAGILYFQKKFEQSQRINFSVTFSTLFTKATITPGQVVTVNNSLHGGSNNVIITDMTINPDMRVDFTGVVLNYLEDWGDLTPAAITVVEDTSEGFPSAEDGTNTATIYLYKRASSTPAVTDITDPVTYTFSDGTIAESIGTWSREVSSGDDPIYIISAVASAKTETDTIARSEWSTPVVMAQNGADGDPGTPGVDAGNWSLQSTFTFSSTDYNTVAWVGGELYTGEDTYTITGGNTGNISALTYIYFNPTASTTLLQTTTVGSDAVGAGKILIGVAKNNTDTSSDAIFQIFGGTGGTLFTADHIAAGTITGDKIAANTIDSAQINTGAITIGSWSGAGDLAEQNNVSLTTQVTNKSLANLDSTANTKLTGIATGADVTQTQLNLGAAIDDAKANGVTLISGGYIRTSLIQASAIVIGDLNGADSFTSYDTARVNGTAASTVKSRADIGYGVYSGSYNAYNTDRVNGTAASTVVSNAANGNTGYTRTESWKYNETYINGGNIYTGTVNASQINTNALSTAKFYCSDSNTAAYSVYRSYTTTSSSTVAIGGRKVGSGQGVYGTTTGTTSSSAGVLGTSNGSATSGVAGTSSYGKGVRGESNNSGVGVYGYSKGWAMQGVTDNTSGYWGFLTDEKIYAADGFSPFTGSHLCFTKQTVQTGDIVFTEGSLLISISEAFPFIGLTQDIQNKAVIGVVANIEDKPFIDSDLFKTIKSNKKLFDTNPINEREVVYEADIPEEGIKKGDTRLVNEGYEQVLKSEHMQKTETSKDKGLLHPDTLGGVIDSQEYQVVEVNALGEGGINVCSAGGDIAIGDYICSSNIPGKGMKQADDILHNYTVAKALEAVIWANEPENIKMIACTYHCG